MDDPEILWSLILTAWQNYGKRQMKYPLKFLNYLMLLGFLAIVRICHWLLVIWLLLLWPPADVQGQQFEFRGKRKQQTMNFQLIKNLIVIPVYINDKGPFNFILDTGVSPLLITDPSILDTLDFSQLRPMKISGLGQGEMIEAYSSNTIDVSVGASRMDNVPTAILKSDIFNLSNFLGIHVHGLIGYYFLNSFVVHVDYFSHTMKFYRHELKRKIKGFAVPMEMILNKPYLHLSVMAPNVGLFNARLLMDSGASFALSLESLAGQKFPLPDSNITANLGMGFGGLISGHIGRVHNLSIGRVTLSDVLTNYPDYADGAAKVMSTGRNGSIGAELLRRFHITYDYRNSVVYLKPNSALKNAFDHDMSGMEVYMEEGKSNRFFIERIEENSPAEKQGIRPGTELLEINFKSVTSLDLQTIVQLLKAGDGKNVVLKLFQNDEIVYKVLTLKKRI